MEEEASIFAKLPVASWSVGGQTIAFSVKRLEAGGANRLVPHRRIYRDGARHDDTGCDEDVHDWQVIFWNGNTEEGVVMDGYPDEANKFQEMMKIHEVGDLVVPTIGKRRCRIATWRRVEDRSEALDFAAFQVRWAEDNEDNASQAALQAPSASSVTRDQAEECSDSVDESGPSLGDTMSDIRQAGDDIESLVNAPGEFASDVTGSVESISNSIDQVNETTTNAAATYSEEIANLFTDPAATRPARALAKLEDTVRSTITNKLPPPFTDIVQRRYTTRVSIFDVAASEQQDALALMAINPKLPDVGSIDPGTPVNVMI
jgi:prophage DNA circulation protein